MLRLDNLSSLRSARCAEDTFRQKISQLFKIVPVVPSGTPGIICSMKNILLIEDDTGIAQYICSNLEKSNYHITHVAEASNGLKTALSQPWSCILLDRMLPVEVDGLDILKALRALGNSTPVIIVSALEKN